MRTMMIAAAAVLSLSAGAAYADGGDSSEFAITRFTQLPNVIAQAQEQAPAVATAQNGQAVHAYVANSSRGTWLYQPNQNQGPNS